MQTYEMRSVDLPTTKALVQFLYTSNYRVVIIPEGYEDPANVPSANQPAAPNSDDTEQSQVVDGPPAPAQAPKVPPKESTKPSPKPSAPDVPALPTSQAPPPTDGPARKGKRPQWPHIILRDPAEALVLHVKVFVAAKDYRLPELRRRAAQLFADAVATHWDSAAFSRAIDFLYRRSARDDDELRRLVTRIIREHHTALVRRPEFVRLMNTHGLLGLDILRSGEEEKT